MILFSLYIIFSFSAPVNSSTFMGRWKRINAAGSLTDKAFMSLTLIFYHFKNLTQNKSEKNNGLNLIPINSTYENITNIFDNDSTLGVIGNARLDNSTYTSFYEKHLLCAGVYRRKKSDIFLVCPLKDLLHSNYLTFKNISDITNNSINAGFNEIIFNISKLFSKIENIIKDFDYNQAINISQQEYNEIKMGLQRRDLNLRGFPQNFNQPPNIKQRKINESINNMHKNIYLLNDTEYIKKGKYYKHIQKHAVINRLQSYRKQIENLTEYNTNFITNTTGRLIINIANRNNYFSLIYLHATENGTIDTPYDLNGIVEGFYVPNNRKNTIISLFELKAQGIDASLLDKESRTYGAISGIFFAFLVLIYKSIKFPDYHLTSALTILMNTSYDLGYGNLLNLIGRMNEPTNVLFSVISIGYATLFFINTFRVFKIWSIANEELLRGLPPLMQQRYYSAFLFQCNLMYIISLLFFTKITSHSTFIMLVLFSTWIPQIIFNVLKGCRNSIPPTYYVGITYIRLFEMGINFLSPTSLFFFKKSCRSSFFLAFLWSTFQVIFLFLQKKFGGAFFLPKSMKNEPYDYYSKKPEPHTECPICLSEINTDNEVAVITPCNHAFHEACLRRWMVEQSICPMCRRSLPPISEPEPIV